MKRPALLLVAISAFFLIGGLLAMARTYVVLRRWQPVAARVIAADIAKFSKGGTDRYRGEITVRYSVNDVMHQIPFSLFSSYSTEAGARAELNRYPPGTTMRVFYNPENADDMLLDLTASPRFLLFPGILTAAGMILGAYSMRTLHKMGTCLCPGCAASVELWDKFCYACDSRLPKQKKLIRL
jgi:hypothetical protein